MNRNLQHPAPVSVNPGRTAALLLAFAAAATPVSAQIEWRGGAFREIDSIARVWFSPNYPGGSDDPPPSEYRGEGAWARTHAVEASKSYGGLSGHAIGYNSHVSDLNSRSLLFTGVQDVAYIGDGNPPYSGVGADADLDAQFRVHSPNHIRFGALVRRTNNCGTVYVILSKQTPSGGWADLFDWRGTSAGDNRLNRRQAIDPNVWYRLRIHVNHSQRPSDSVPTCAGDYFVSMLPTATWPIPMISAEVINGGDANGNIIHLAYSDDQRYVVASEPGGGGAGDPLHVVLTEYVARAAESRDLPLHIDLESAIDGAGGTTTVSLYDWTTGQFADIEVLTDAADDTTRTITVPSPLPYLSSSQELKVRLVHAGDQAFNASIDRLAIAYDHCEADLDPAAGGDGRIDTNDLFAFLALYQAQDLAADLEPDGVINTNDFFAFLAAYQQGC